MKGHAAGPTPANPFSSSRVRPGALAFLFDPRNTPETLLNRVQDNGWWGEIVGPHGAGKSALLAALIPVVERAGRRVVLLELHDGQRRLPPNAWTAIGSHAATLVVVDGYEQLSRLSRWRLKRCCRNRRLGLLVTSHVSVGLPALFHTAPELTLALQIVEQLQNGYPRLIGPEDVAAPFVRHEGNLREMLFDLYDLYEERRGTDSIAD
jgi:hypothetical protein